MGQAMRLKPRIRQRFRAFLRPLITSTSRQRLHWVMGVVLFSSLFAMGFADFYSHYTIAWDRQAQRCLNVRFLLVDRRETTPERNVIIAYLSQQAAPIIQNGTLMGKVVRGMPGDTVEILKDERILINGQEVARGMPHLYGINAVDQGRFFGRRVLGENEYWVMGMHRLSFDSRYWGPIHRE